MPRCWYTCKVCICKLVYVYCVTTVKLKFLFLCFLYTGNTAVPSKINNTKSLTVLNFCMDLKKD